MEDKDSRPRVWVCERLREVESIRTTSGKIEEKEAQPGGNGPAPGFVKEIGSHRNK